MLLTAWSYARFSQNSEKSGSAYSYTASLGPKSGFVGWCSLLDYLLLPLINVLLAAIYLTALIPSLPYWFWVLVSAGLVTLVNCFRIRLLANLSLVFVFAPIILMVIFVYLVVGVLALLKVTNMYLPWLRYGMVNNHCYHLLLGPQFYAFHS